MMSAQRTLLCIAQENQLEHDHQILKRTPHEDALTHFPVDSFVLVAYPSEGMHRGPPNKLMTNLKGPMRVVDKDGAIYHVRDLTTNKVESVHVSRLSLFHYDATRTSPADAAHADRQEFTIETILNHRGDKKKRSTLEFEVKWLGYPDSYNSLEQPSRNGRITPLPPDSWNGIPYSHPFLDLGFCFTFLLF